MAAPADNLPKHTLAIGSDPINYVTGSRESDRTVTRSEKSTWLVLNNDDQSTEAASPIRTVPAASIVV